MDPDSKKLNRPVVTILMLTYNRAPFIAQAIQSVFNQTYTNWKLIIIDDGSTDKTPDIISSFSDARIKYIHHEDNCGISKRRRESLQYADGKYVAVLDSDDVYFDPKKIDRQVSFMEENPDCAVVGTFITLIDAEGEIIGKYNYSTKDKAIRDRILVRNQFAHSSVLMRKSALTKTRGYSELTSAEDLDLFLQLGQLGVFANIPEYMTAYRIHKGGVSRKRLETVNAIFSIIHQYAKVYPNATKAYIYNSIRYLRARLSL